MAPKKSSNRKKAQKSTKSTKNAPTKEEKKEDKKRKKCEKDDEDDFQEIKIIKSFMATHFVYTIPIYDEKRSELSNQYIFDAYDLLFKSKEDRKTRFTKAWKFFNVAMRFAPTGTEDVARVFAHRAEFLFMIDKFEECIKDCENLKHIEYPEHDALASCIFMKFRCYYELGYHESREECQKVIEWFRGLDYGEDLADALQNRLAYIFDRLPFNTIERKITPTYLDYELVGAKKDHYSEFDRNANLPCSSNLIEMVKGKNGTVHFVACEDITPGTVLVVEDKLHNSMKPSRLDKQGICDFCQRRCWSSIPCEGCTEFQYCSEYCRAQDWDYYHQLECEVIPSRYITPYKTFFRFFIQLKQKAGSLEKFIEFFANEDTYFNLSDLRTEPSLEKRNVYLNDAYYEPDIHFACDAAYYLAVKAPFLRLIYPSVHPRKLFRYEPEVVALAAAILRSFYLYVANACIFQSYSRYEGLQYNQTFAVYPVCRFFNHSCAPNAAYFTSKKHEMVVYAKYPIKKGEEITVSHIYNTYSELNTKARNEILNNYDFTNCHCEACEKDWGPSHAKPLEELLSDKPRVYKEIVKKINLTFELLADITNKDPHIEVCGLPYDIISEMSKVLKLIADKGGRYSREYEFFFAYITRTFIANFGNMVDEHISDTSCNYRGERTMSLGFGYCEEFETS